MQRIWANDTWVIEDELRKLISLQSPTTLYRREEASHKTTPAKILPQKTYKMLIFRKAEIKELGIQFVLTDADWG